MEKKKRKKRSCGLLIFLLILVQIFLSREPLYVQASGIRWSSSKIVLLKGQSKLLKVHADGKRVTWSSADQAVVKVSKKGKIRGISAGRTSVAVNADGKNMGTKSRWKTRA